MLSNTSYNLMETAAVISKGLHRYDKFMEDAKDCPDCRQMWNQLKQADEEQLRKIVPHLREHLDREEQPQARRSAA